MRAVGRGRGEARTTEPGSVEERSESEAAGGTDCPPVSSNRHADRGCRALKRAVGFIVFLALLGGAVSIGLASRKDQLDPTLSREAGETLQIRLIYRDPLNGWPRGPFAHNCLPENADGIGDFDGDGLRDRVEFRPVYGSDDLNGWILRQRFGDGRAVSQRLEAECPEVIGAVDIDGDGKDELFYDTGQGMTAALIDILKLHKGTLKNVVEVPDDFSIYVGSSNAGISNLDCYRTDDVAGFLVRTKDPVTRQRSMLIYELRGRRLLQGIEDAEAVANPVEGDLSCFDLQWIGY